MQVFLWVLSFLFLIAATLTGIGVSIGVLAPEWIAVCLFCVACMFSAAEYATKYYGDNDNA